MKSKTEEKRHTFTSKGLRVSFAYCKSYYKPTKRRGCKDDVETKRTEVGKSQTNKYGKSRVCIK